MDVSVRLGILIVAAVLLLPVPADAGWFGWLFGRVEPRVQTTTPASPVPAIDFYGLTIAGGSLIYLARRRR